VFFRISKYDPRYRSADGGDTRDEWTDISVFEDYHSDWNEFLRIETAYWTCIREFLERIGIEKIAITNIERHPDIDDLGIGLCADALSFLERTPPKNGQFVDLSTLERYFRAAFRGAFWFYGVGEHTTHFGFGFDSYCYLRTNCNIKPPSVPGVFVEDVSDAQWPFEIPFKNISAQSGNAEEH